MLNILFLRHAPTPWNIEGRIQGRADIAIANASRNELATRALPHLPWLEDAVCIASPLKRAIETAALITNKPISTHAALIETDWGEFEGQRLNSLRRRLGNEMSDNEARGLDFEPPGGESPRQVRTRLADWLFDELDHDAVAVTHKGVIRAALSLATGWHMDSPPPHKLIWQACHWMKVDKGHRELNIERLNIAYRVRS